MAPYSYTLPCFHAKKNPDHPLFRYDSASVREGYEDITWHHAVNNFETAAQIIRHRLGGGAVVDRTPPPVVGILASTSAILYATLIFGTLRAGCPIFPLSTRYSDIAIAHLITESGVKYLLVSQDAHMQNIARKANSILESKNVHITVVSIPTYEEICADEHVDLDALPPLQPIDDDHLLIIAHSSGNYHTTVLAIFDAERRIPGSTSFPKIIPLTQKYFFKMNGPRVIDFSTRVQAVHGTAMFHAMGFLSVIRAAFSGMTLSLFPPTTHAVIATPERMLASALSTKSTTMVCPPMFLEHWVHDPSSVEKLRTFSRIFFGGGPLARSVGDALDSSGITSMPLYGITEVGPITQIIPGECIVCCRFGLVHPNGAPWLEATHNHGWEYFQFHASVEPVLLPVDGDTTGSLFQLRVKQSARNCLVLPNTEVDGVPAYDTNDIVQRHPEVPTLYRVYGRVDDQIMHSNGEKTNPGPIEQILTQDPRVKAAIMFGRERPHAGVIIAASEDVLDMESFRNTIWPTVERANAFAPSHSRIFKNMIVLATLIRPFQVTAKGTPRRQAILEDYAQDIHTAYAAFDRAAAPASNQAHREISVNEALEIVREHVHTNVGPSISDHDNIFDAGADSLLAARIRRGIIRALGGRIPERLASFVYGVTVGALAISDDTPYKNVPASVLDNKDTIVRLREAVVGESPLIPVHGGNGFIYSFVYLQMHFRTGLWAIQVVPETPRTSFVSQTDFYYRKIKEAQPTGPYRIGGYSAGVFMACRVAKLLQEHGDNVIQLALIDSSPFLTITPRAIHTYTAETDFADLETLKAYRERSVRGYCACSRTRGGTSLLTAYGSGGTAACARSNVGADGGGERRVYSEVVRAIIAWMREVNAPVTLYKASRGVVAGVAPEAQKEWWALGLDWCFTDLRVVEVEAGHDDILKQDELIEDLQMSVT
ncbi:hypothetical protein C8J57DRAFT_1471415 [Mycena rebaudengoi]|nr:hypothetical protein C8J57DRAFT_1471415 [Mycena rebaudengoi]